MKVRLIFKTAHQISPNYDMALEHKTFDVDVSPDQEAVLADLSDAEVEQVILMWAKAFRSHVEKKRTFKRLEAKR